MISSALIPPPSSGPADPRPAVRSTRAGELVLGDRPMLNMACNDYLGLAHDPRVLAAAHQALDQFGVGTAAGRILSGSTTVHRELEERLAGWVGCQAAVLHSSCWTANAAILSLLATLAKEADRPLAVFSDRFNHASIIDAIRAQKPLIDRTGLFDHEHLPGLAEQLAVTPVDVERVVIIDGVFSMEGNLAPLAELVALCDEHHALLIVDDSHGTGVAGPTGRGTPEATNTHGRIDVITGTLGKALGGAIGGFVAGPADLMNALRAKSRPYIFSNNPPTSVAAAALAALDVLAEDPNVLETLRARTRQLRDGVAELGLRSFPGEHPIVPVILGADQAAAQASQRLQDNGVFASALFFPVVPRDTARLRLQVSAAHTAQQIDHLLGAMARSQA